jgi:hypothetical protein
MIVLNTLKTIGAILIFWLILVAIGYATSANSAELTSCPSYKDGAIVPECLATDYYDARFDPMACMEYDSVYGSMMNEDCLRRLQATIAANAKDVPERLKINCKLLDKMGVSEYDMNCVGRAAMREMIGDTGRLISAEDPESNPWGYFILFLGVLGSVVFILYKALTSNDHA